MHARATGTFEDRDWNEQPIGEIEGLPKLARASATNVYRGDLEGTGSVEYLFLYREDGSAAFVGLEWVEGRLGGRAGSFVLQHSGTYEDGAARSTWLVVPGSATGELRGLRGEGGFVARHAQDAPYTLDYEVD